MLLMVVERFKQGAAPVGERFRAQGRMMPDGVVYHASWLEPSGERCFQLMEADSPQALQPWIDRWSDLMEFEVSPVLTSKDFWASREAAGTP